MNSVLREQLGEGLGQRMSKKSVRMMIKEVIELGDPNVSHGQYQLDM